MPDDDLTADLRLIQDGSAPTYADETTGEVLDTSKAQSVLLILRAAGLKLPYAMDQDQAEEVWAPMLEPYPVDVLVEVVREWIEAPGNEWPTVGDITTMAERNVRRAAAIERGLAKRIPGQVCPECEDTGFTEDHPAGHPGPTSVRFCGTCRKERLAAQLSGCDLPEHVHRGGCERCSVVKKRRAAG